MSSTPKAILFQKEYNFENGQEPLFKSQVELATYLFNKSPNDYASQQSVKISLNKAIQGNRPLAPKLKNAIFQVLEDRITDKKLLQEVREELFNSFTQQYLLVRQKSRKDGTKHEKNCHLKFEQMLQKPGHHVVISDNLIELLNTSDANRVVEMILQNIGILGPNKKKKHSEIFRYEYFVKDEATSTGLWKNFYYYLREHKNMEHKKVQELLTNANKAGYLRIFTATSYIACQNLYLHNIKREKPQAFRVYDLRKVICKIPFQVLTNILDNLYIPLKTTLKRPQNRIIVSEDPYGYPTKELARIAAETYN